MDNAGLWQELTNYELRAALSGAIVTQEISEKVLVVLSAQEEKVLRMRFGRVRSRSKIATIIGISIRTVRRIESAALTKLRLRLLREVGSKQDPSWMLFLEVIEIDRRLGKLLHGAGIRTIGDLLTKPAADLMRCRGCREATVRTVQNMLDALEVEHQLSAPGLRGESMLLEA
jgi:DNA-binding CsgD family transcriptional regulator